MPEGLKKFIDPIVALSPAKRWTVGGIVLISALFFGLLITTANRVDYKPLFSNLGNEDAGEIMKKLKEQKVPARISDDGKAILVPCRESLRTAHVAGRGRVAPGKRHRFRNIRPEELRHDRIRAETELPACPAGGTVAHHRPDSRGRAGQGPPGIT